MCAPNFRSVAPTVQPVECKQTHTQTDANENITISANAGGKKEKTMWVLKSWAFQFTQNFL